MRGFTLDRSLHLAIDMQRLFAEQTEWFMPWLERVLPNVAAIARHAPQRTLFTRFIPPRVPEQMPGGWQDNYRHWRAMTRERLFPACWTSPVRSPVSAPRATSSTRRSIRLSAAPALRLSCAARGSGP